MNTELLERSILASLKAGKSILEVYNSDNFSVEHKQDNSPLTLADKNSHKVITQILEFTEIPILSEEGKNIEYTERSTWTTFWLIDPLDGTKEFIKRNGEFTVNIALIHNQSPVLGVIYVPVLKELYFGTIEIGAYKIENIDYLPDNFILNDLILQSVKLPVEKSTKFRVVASRSHNNTETQQFIDKLKDKYSDIELVSKGSSLKICMIADGSAAIYPRFAPTMEWDTAAGHAIVKSAGGKIIMANDLNTELHYNKENLLNPWFIATI